MELREVVRRRRMVRRYADRPVDPALVDRALEHASRAPSAGFTQAVEFLVLDEREQVARFWDVTADAGAESSWLRGMRSAPVVVVPLTSREAYLDRYAEADKGWTDRDPGRWPVPFWYVDAGMASLLVLQTAVDEGLGACFFGIPPGRVAALREAFGVPGDRLPVGAITLGHRLEDAGPAGSPSRRPRRPWQDLVHRGRWRR
ncbi:nitroreductase family protein [Nocardioides euryhalodurans]|uniref:Nitroreductase family protein n=1 Tax=Nocardioides euryhalodurans TaxID=2518370 RepID=A0A4P7GMN0_9ACTN|nr:nitroreductase family protein [Nocardioides euryhalodurans]QBR93179.1 nitroreductase family protein [Nocardioides euryhalodurans]